MKQIAFKLLPLVADIDAEQGQGGLVSIVGKSDNELRRFSGKDFHEDEDFLADRYTAFTVSRSRTPWRCSVCTPRGQEIALMAHRGARRWPPHFVLAVDKHDAHLRKLWCGLVTARDYVLTQSPYNDPALSSFVVWHGTVQLGSMAASQAVGAAPGLPYPCFFEFWPFGLDAGYSKPIKKGVRLVVRP